MSEMVERVARALVQAFESGPRLNQNDAKALAWAAIEAMRDLPASATVDSDGCQRWDWKCQTCGGPKENWQMVIDEALKP